MSWLAKSIVESLRSDQGDEDDADADDSGGEASDERSDDGAEPGTPTRGVKEDINELTQTLTRQFWGVASFLAPPPPPSSSSPNPESPGDAAAESPRFAGIRSDLAEIGGKVRSGIAVLSGNMAVTEISKIASTLFASEEGEEDEDEEIEDAVGVTDEVLTFVNNISMHPETWLDFPLLPDDSNGFYMSDAQQEHALAVERLAPQLATLKVDLCPSRMSEDYFWKIYFVLVHPRLSNHDAELLSTPQIVRARMMLLPDLRNRTKPDSESPNKDASPEEVAREIIISPSNAPGEAPPLEAHTEEELTIPVPSTELETEKHPIQSNELEIIEKCVIEEESSTKAEKRSDTPAGSSNTSIIREEEEDVDEWLEEETGEAGGASGGVIPLGNEEDVSFSDLEDEIEDDGVHVGSLARVVTIDSPSKEEGGWIQLNKNGDGAVRSGDTSSSATKESNDWLDVDIDTV